MNGCINFSSKGVHTHDQYNYKLLNLGTLGKVEFVSIYSNKLGTSMAKLLATIMDQVLVKYLYNSSIANLRDNITNAFLQIDKCMYQNGVSGLATATIALYFVQNGRLYLVNLGDAGGIVWDQQIIAYTHGHTPKQEKDRIEEAGGSVLFDDGILKINGEYTVSRAFGGYSLKIKDGEYYNNGPIIVTPHITDIQLISGTKYKLLLATRLVLKYIDSDLISKELTCANIIAKAKAAGETGSLGVVYLSVTPQYGEIKQNVLDHVITINAHGGWLSDYFELPAGINLLVPHHKGTDHKYKTEHCSGISYEQQLYAYGYFNYTAGWRLYKSGEMVGNMVYSPLKKNCHHLIAKDYLVDIMIPCMENNFKRGWCPIFVSAGGAPLVYNGVKRIKIKTCNKFTLKELCQGLIPAIEDLESKGIIDKMPRPIVLIPFTCNAEGYDSEMVYIAKYGQVPVQIGDTITKVAWNTPINEIYQLLASKPLS